jgi:predicted transcriptional regulator
VDHRNPQSSGSAAAAPLVAPGENFDCDATGKLMESRQGQLNPEVGGHRAPVAPLQAAVWHPWRVPIHDASKWVVVCWHTMKRTTVKLPDELDARLRHEAQRRGTTVSELTREAIEALLGGGGKGRRRLLAAGAGRSGLSDVSEQIEQILRSEVA